MQHTYTPPGTILYDSPAISTSLDFNPAHKAYLTQVPAGSAFGANGNTVNDADGNPVLVFFDRNTGQAYARVATYDPNDNGADSNAIAAIGAIPSFSGTSEQHGYFVPVSALNFSASADENPYIGDTVGATASVTTGNTAEVSMGVRVGAGAGDAVTGVI